MSLRGCQSLRVLGDGFYFFRREDFVERRHQFFAVGDDIDAFFECQHANSKVFGAVERKFAVGAVTDDAVLPEDGLAVGADGGGVRLGSGGSAAIDLLFGRAASGKQRKGKKANGKKL